MKFIECLENSVKVKALVVRDLSEMGVAIDRRTCLTQQQSKDSSERLKKSKSKDESLNPGSSAVVFGNSLRHIPCVATEQFGAVPDAVQLLEKHLTVEGLFRRSASMARLKDLRVRVDAGESLSDDTLPLDVASLVKQFFRELPEPLLTSVLYENFLQCVAIDNEPGQVDAILLLCLLLPSPNLSTLRYLMHFLAQVASISEQNKMDASNLAVCLTPNLLYAGSAADKADRVNVNGGGPLQAETGVIRLLILNTNRIGLVSDDLVQRAALLSSCFPLCDDLEAGEVNEETPKMRKKKNKKRSGSLQGLVTSFSSSFSRWRSKDKQSQNSSLMSDRSALSYISFEKSVVLGEQNATEGDLDETIEALDIRLCPTITPCLIRKRKAEEEFVPFSAKKRHAILSSMPHKSLLAGTPFTPRTKNYAGSVAELDPTPHIDFAPGADIVFSATPQLPTPNMRMNKLPSSASSVRLSRSGCFSPKTNKKSFRNSFRGLLRRLSGSKDSSKLQSQMLVTSMSDSNGSHLSHLPEASHLDDSASKASGSSKKGISFFRRCKKAPSSPAAHVMADFAGEYIEHEMNGVNEVDLSFVAPLLTKDERGDFAAKSGRSPHDLPPRPRPRSRSAEGLRRGRPNTLKCGLPSPARRRSVEVKQRRNMDRRMDTTATTGVLDTSPIRKCSTDGENEAFASPDQPDPMEMTDQGLKKTYFGSKMSVESMERIDVVVDQLDSEHDRAFTEESILMHEEDVLDVDTEARHVAAVTRLCNESEEQRLGVTSGNGIPDNSQISASTEIVPKHLELNVDTPHVEKGSTLGKALVDADSAVDLATSESWAQLQHCPSRQSVKSQDSGLGLNMEGDDVGITAAPVDEEQENKAVQVQSITKETNVTRAHDDSLMYMKEGRQSIGVRSSFKQKKADPCLQVSAEVHHLLSKAGSLVVDIKSATAVGATIVTNTKGSCRIPETGSISHLSCEEKKQISERCSSPLRFAKATSRTIVPAKVSVNSGHISPRSSFRKAPVLPISTNFLRVSFRENCQGKPSVVYPATKETTANPLQLISETATKDDQSLPELDDAQTPKIDCNPNATPKIKSALVTPGMANRLGKRGFPLQAVVATPVAKTTRSPLRPLKRLQASPKSPRGQRSPRRMTSPGKNVRLATGMTLAVPLSDSNV